jgi:hypothetical protein
VSGQISLTCDAWQADNTDAYFAVTGHWIQEHAPGEWTVEHALLGFAQMNTSHDGARLGQALFKICGRLNIVSKVRTKVGITHILIIPLKVGHVTSDNAKNNTTMLQEFARCYEAETHTSFNTSHRHIRYA